VDTADAANVPFGQAWKVKEAVQKVAEENPGFFRKMFELFDAPFPDADGFVLRGLDARKHQLRKLREGGLLKAAPAALRKDARFAAVKNGEDAAGLIRLKAEEAGAAYRKSLETLDAARLPEESVDAVELARRIHREVLAPLQQGPAATRPTAQAVQDEIDELLAKAEGGRISLAQAEDLKRGYDPFARFDRTSPPAEVSKAQAYRDMREVVKKAVEEKAEAISRRTGGREALDWRAAKRSYREMSSLDEIAKDRLEDARGANRLFSLSDNIGGFVAGALGGGLALGAGPWPLAL
jgi:hypothetical protein